MKTGELRPKGKALAAAARKKQAFLDESVNRDQFVRHSDNGEPIKGR